MLARLAGNEEQRYERWVGNGFVQIPDDFGQRRDELGLTDHLRHVPCADRLRRRDGDVDLGIALAFEAGGERDQSRVVPHGQRRDRRRIDTAGQECAHRDVGAHVLGHRVLQHLGDLSVALVFVACLEGDGGESRGEVPRHLGRLTGPHAGVATRFQPAYTAVQRLGLGNVLQHRVVLGGALVDTEVDSDNPGEIEQAFLLAAEHCSARTGRHVQRLDAEWVAGAEQFAFHRVPQGKGEHAPQPGQRVGAPVVIGGDDRLAVPVGGEYGAMLGAQLLAQLQVVVDLAVEHQHIPVGGLRRAPAQRLVAVGDIDDRQPVEPQHRGWPCVVVRPCARLVGTTVAHQVRRARNRGYEVCGHLTGRVGNQGKQSAHRASMPNRRGVSRPAS